MNASVIEQNTTSNFVFEVKVDNVNYRVTVWTNQKGKFIDDTIEDIENSESVPCEVRDKILKYLSDNWSGLVSE